MKKYYRCNVCGDIHYGLQGPKNCPTCNAENAFCEITQKEVANLLGLVIEESKDGCGCIEEDVIQFWKKWTTKSKFKLNPDPEHVNLIAEGVLKNEDKFGLKLCPCRLRDGSRERDLELICPCNFYTHDTWKEKGMCWCGLFVEE